MQPIEAPSLADIRRAAERLDPSARHTPLIPLQHPGPQRIWLKLENLQPIGSFKLRGAGNALALTAPARLRAGVSTASAGNMAQGVAWDARRRGIPCRVVVPDHAPAAKIRAVEALGAEVIAVPFAVWWTALVDGGLPGIPGEFIHPVCDGRVVAGNGTIALELDAEVAEFDAVVAPFGGGGLSCGIAAALRCLRPEVAVYGAEVATAAPLAASWSAGEPREVSYTPSFVDGIGGKSVLAPMWPLARSLLAGSLVVELEEVAAAVRLLVRHGRVVAEGAAAAAVAAALRGIPGRQRIVCIVSGGNIDSSTLCALLEGRLP